MLDGQNIVRADLEAARRRLLGSPWIADATLRRQLPATIEIADRGARSRWRWRAWPAAACSSIAGDGIVLGPVGAAQAGFDLPIVDGLTPCRAARCPAPASASACRPASIPSAPAWSAAWSTRCARRTALLKLVSEVDVTDVEDAVVLLGDDPARVHLGHEDFARRVRAYRDLAPTLLQHVDAIDSADVRYDGRVFVRPARGRPVAAPDS